MKRTRGICRLAVLLPLATGTVTSGSLPASALVAMLMSGRALAQSSAAQATGESAAEADAEDGEEADEADDSEGSDADAASAPAAESGAGGAAASTVGDEDPPLGQEDQTSGSPGSQNPWGAQLSPAQGQAPSSSGAPAARSVEAPVPGGALDQTFSIGLSLLGVKTDEASFQSGKLETRTYGFGTQVGIPLNPRHSLAVRGVLFVHDYDGNTLDDKVDFALGVSGRGELFQTEGVLKPFLGIGLAVSSETTLGQTAKDELYPSEVTKTAVSLELDLGARFWLASGRRFFLDLIAGLMRSDVYYEETTRNIVERTIDGERYRVATEDIDRGYFLLNGSPVSFLSRAEVVFGYRL